MLRLDGILVAHRSTIVHGSLTRASIKALTSRTVALFGSKPRVSFTELLYFTRRGHLLHSSLLECLSGELCIWLSSMLKDLQVDALVVELFVSNSIPVDGLVFARG